MHEPQKITDTRYLIMCRLAQHRRIRFDAFRKQFLGAYSDLPGLANLEGWLSALDNAILEVAAAPTLDHAREVVDCFCVQSDSLLMK
jgi:hypothetical protein